MTSERFELSSYEPQSYILPSKLRGLTFIVFYINTYNLTISFYNRYNNYKDN